MGFNVEYRDDRWGGTSCQLTSDAAPSVHVFIEPPCRDEAEPPAHIYVEITNDEGDTSGLYLSYDALNTLIAELQRGLAGVFHGQKMLHLGEPVDAIVVDECAERAPETLSALELVKWLLSETKPSDQVVLGSVYVTNNN